VLKAPVRVFGRPTPAPSSPRAHGIRPALFYGLFAGLLGTNVLTAVGFLMAPDIAGLMNGQSETVYAAYEDRIAQLRIEVDRLHSRQYAQAGDINLQLQELTQQQEVLLEQHTYVKQLAQKAAELGIETADLAPEDDDEDQPVVFTSALQPRKGDAASEIEAAAASMKQMMDDSRLALAAISEEANSATGEILGELKSIGITPAMPDGDDGVGGPFIPATDGGDQTNIVDDANEVFEALTRFKAARGAIDAAPIHKPLAGAMRMSSTYGNRKDPFTGRRAFHAGMDFPAPQGTTVLSAGKGKVTFVGQKSGYGNVVEVTHGPNLVTRYGHLSAFLVKQGQEVGTGTPIAKVGSTGRSTGPHLHFEVRRKDSAVDPSAYLAAGKRLIRFLGAA
jgi:murein DD-endopeptidase MepM/ murein hydrolase activator NlpD